MNRVARLVAPNQVVRTKRIETKSRSVRGAVVTVRWDDQTQMPQNRIPMTAQLPDFSRNDGLLPAIAQDADTGDVLMLAWMNREAFAETQSTGRAVYFSRSRGRLWRKGEESGHTQEVVGIYVDCDADTILLKVRQQGAACHEGYRSCFFRQLNGDAVKITAERLVDPAKVYDRDSNV